MSVFMLRQAGEVNTVKPEEGKGPVDKDRMDMPAPVPGDTGQELVMTKGEKEIKVKVDGPVGRVFTDALNKALALESYMTMIPDNLYDEDEKDEDGEEDVDLQVYAWDADTLNMSDAVEITNEIVKKTDRQFIIAMEAHDARLSSVVGLLDRYRKMPNVRICYTRSGAVDAVLTHLKGK